MIQNIRPEKKKQNKIKQHELEILATTKKKTKKIQEEQNTSKHIWEQKCKYSNIKVPETISFNWTHVNGSEQIITQLANKRILCGNTQVNVTHSINGQKFVQQFANNVPECESNYISYSF